MYYNPTDYLMIAGGCAALACCLTCCAKHWDDPPDWCPNWWQPEWKRDEPEGKRVKNYNSTTGDTIQLPIVAIAKKDKQSPTTGWEMV